MSWLSWLSRDVLFALRMLRGHPGHAAASLVALGLGLGLTTATFSIVDGLLLRGLPFPESDRIVLLGYENPARGMNGSPVDLHDFADWASRQRSFEGLGAFDVGTATLTVTGGAVRLNASSMTAGVLRLLRAAPALGRGFTRRDEVPGAQPVALLGWRAWRDQFGGDPGIVGRAVRLNGQPATVVGVMPEGFLFPREEELWTPMTNDLAATARGQGDPVVVLGRLRRGVTLRRAQAEMMAIARAIELEHPQTNAGLGVLALPYVEFAMGSPVKLALLTTLGAVLSVLLIACCNVASLGMARAAQRGREIAVRTAMGAGRARIAAQLLVESMLLAIAGAALGLGLARFAIVSFNRGLVAMGPPFWDRVALDPAALLFALAATFAAGLVSGLAPALHASRTDVDQALRDEGRGSTSRRLGWFNQLVVVAELALCCALLVGTGLMVKSVIKAQTLKLGFARRGILTFRVAVFPQRVPRPADRAAFYGKLLGRLAALPGVQAAAGAETLPGSSSGSAPYAVEGQVYRSAADQPQAHAVAISPGLFAAYRAPLLAGRDFGPLDTAATLPVVIVNRGLARRAWPGQNPLGKRLRLARDAGERWRTVVGVAPDLKMDGLLDRRPEGFYLPVSQRGPERLSFALRTAAPPLALAPAARAAVAALDRDTPIYFVQTMDRMLDDDRAGTSLFGGVFTAFGLAALLLAAVGIYGVIALAIGRRTQEIGIRMALGAGRRDILAMLLRQAVVQLGLGLGCGLPVAWGASRLLAGALFQVQPHDPAVFAVVIATLALVALLATLVPAGRALRGSARSPLSAALRGV
ncbi:MAG TPA: ADOP family duplicated permease [Thermoanaerobaculia bacterium]|nr:ADOP family duplicated permease [Thermoanaerobaculia bacterium]